MSPLANTHRAAFDPTASGRATRVAKWSALATIAAIAGLASCGDGENSLGRVRSGEVEVTGQGVVVIAIDGLRWDHTSLAGYDRDTTPSMQRLARESVVFENAWGVTPTLVGSHVAILSGDDPGIAIPPPLGEAEFPARDIGSDRESRWFVPADLHLLGRHFLGLGWSTAAFVDHPMIAELRGFDRGFRDFVEHRGEPGDQVRQEGAVGVGRRFVQWVNERELDEDWFAYLHMHDLERAWRPQTKKTQLKGVDKAVKGWRGRPEFAFMPPLGLAELAFHTLPPSRASRAQSVAMGEYELRYDRAVRAMDASVARILTSVEDFGRKHNVTVILMGTFGTSMGEHGVYLRAGLAEDADLHVPLLIRPSRAHREALGWGADGAPPVPRIDELVGSIDLAPTLVDLLGVTVDRPLLGASLRPLLEGKRGAVRQRLPVRPSLVPGFGLIEANSRAVVYHPELAEGDARRSWSGVPEFEDETGMVDDAWTRWEELIEMERRALHFGIDVDDGERIQELRLMQGLVDR
ncbi:sulfatase-like hydrolase/transferase [Planctomycetota bacterium]|nr:sulfatase-like hydrolase/transferase [Planctomycetota bacterium]